MPWDIESTGTPAVVLADANAKSSTDALEAQQLVIFKSAVASQISAAAAGVQGALYVAGPIHLKAHGYVSQTTSMMKILIEVVRTDVFNNIEGGSPNPINAATVA